jgi:hypothetical protein
MANNNGSSSTGSNVNPTAQKNAPKGLWLALTLLQQGVESQIPSTSKLTVEGQPVTQAALSSELATDVAIFQSVADTQSQYKAAVAARRAAVPGLKTRYASIIKAIENQFPPGSPVLAQFGIHPPKPKAKLTAQQLAVRAAKAALTRKARGTKGSKQKQAIQTVGTPTVTITPGGTNIVPPQVGSAAPAGSSTSQSNAPATSAGASTAQSSGSSTTGTATGSTGAT